MIAKLYNEIITKFGTKLYDDSQDYDISVYIFGLDLLINKLFYLIILVIYGLVTNKTLYTLVFFLAFESIRKYCGGVHFKNRVVCFIISFMIAILNIELCNKISVNYFYTLINVSLIICLAPVDTPTKVLSNSDRRTYKHTIIYILSFYLILIYLLKHVNNGLSTILSLILITENILLSIGIMNKKIVEL